MASRGADICVRCRPESEDVTSLDNIPAWTDPPPDLGNGSLQTLAHCNCCAAAGHGHTCGTMVSGARIDI